MRMFIYFRSFWTPYSLFDLQVVHCTTHCNPHCIAIPAYIVCGCLSNVALCCCCFFSSSYVFVIRSCAISLYFISLQIRLCFFFTYLCSFLFSTIDLAFLFDKRICIGISARNLWYAWTSFVLNFICLYTVYSSLFRSCAQCFESSKSVVCVLFYFSLAIIVIARMASCCLVLLVNFQVGFLFWFYVCVCIFLCLFHSIFFS